MGALDKKSNLSVISVDDPHLPTDSELQFQKNGCHCGFPSVNWVL